VIETNTLGCRVFRVGEVPGGKGLPKRSQKGKLRLNGVTK
jgi:hypothetical protein